MLGTKIQTKRITKTESMILKQLEVHWRQTVRVACHSLTPASYKEEEEKETQKEEGSCWQ